MIKRFVLTVSLGALMAALTTSSVFANGAVDRYGRSNPRYITETVSGQHSITYDPVLFESGKGVVEVNGDGSTILNLAVYDNWGNLVIQYSGYGAKVWFHPNWTQGYVIKVTNLGYVSNTFSVHTN
jgi:hypothetical protein